MPNLVKVTGICVVLCAVVAAIAISTKTKARQDTDSGQINTSAKAITALCDQTHYKEVCINSLKSGNNTSNVKELIQLGFQVATNALKEALKNSTTLKDAASKDSMTSQALKNCETLMNSAMDDFRASSLKIEDVGLGEYTNRDLNIWLSAALTFQGYCLDQFDNITSNDVGQKLRDILKTSRQLTSNSLNMVAGLSTWMSLLDPHRQLIATDRTDNDTVSNNDLPYWVGPERGRFLAAAPGNVKADAIVAKDGSGQFKTINDALKTIPMNNPKTFVLYIKEGVYNEKVIVTSTMTNVMFLGDGAIRSRITGNRNFIDGVDTMSSASVYIMGNNFMAKDIGFENTAGAAKHQAVALLVQSDKAIFFQCNLDAFQDTLFAIAHSQFFRDCTISGTQDFIFGDSSVIFQNCNIIVRKPLPGQRCYVTAQGREEEKSNTGIVLQNCVISGDKDYLPVKMSNPAYLGRPWKQFAKTIVMQSQIDDIIRPEGWYSWDNKNDTCYYAEYGNRGPGSVETDRVKWRGVKKISPSEAESYTVARFLKEDWIKPTGVPYASGLMQV